MLKYYYVLFFALCFSIVPGKVRSQELIAGMEMFLAKSDSFIPAMMKKYGMVGFSMAVVDAEEPVIYKNYGYENLERKITASENTVYRIASVSKVFTAMAVMKLRDEGKIDLNAPIENYLKALHFQYTPGLPIITIHDLLTHTSGLPDNIDNGSLCANAPDQESIISETNKLYLTIPAGLKMNYSNTGYALLGCLVEKISGEKFPDYLEHNFFSPMQMAHTGFLKAGEIIQHAAAGYLADSTFFDEPVLRDIAAGGVYSSASDLTHLCSLLLDAGRVNGKQVIASATLQEMMTNKISEVKLASDDEFGYGLFIHELGSDKDSLIGKNIGHGGDSRVFHSIVVTFPALNIGFVLLTNSESGGAFTKSAVLQIAREYIRDVKGIAIQKGTKNDFTATALRVDNLNNAMIEGTYGSGGEDFVTMIRKNDVKLVFRQDKTKLVLKKNEAGVYSVKYMLLKFIPVKVKAASFGFRLVDDRIYMKAIDNKSKSAEYISVKDNQIVMPESWKLKVGKYSIDNLCSGNMLMYPDEIKIAGNKLLLHRSDPLKEEDDIISFNIINDHIAVSDGIDRGAGNSLELLPNGNIYWSGYEMKPVKE
ncbi:MAG: beta-lactamase family protein [Chitinophagaceae bacterium]|nr:beta-lactamase family protein [Chitinophagaceae bacterium]